MGIAVIRSLAKSPVVPKRSAVAGIALAALGMAYTGSPVAAVGLYVLGHLLASGGIREVPLIGPMISSYLGCPGRGYRISPWKRPSLLRETSARATVSSFEGEINSLEEPLVITLVSGEDGREAYLGVPPEAGRRQKLAILRSFPPEVEEGWALSILPDRGLISMSVERVPEDEAMTLLRRRALSVETALLLTPPSKEERITVLRGELEAIKKLMGFVSSRKTQLFRTTVVMASRGRLGPYIARARSMGFSFSALGLGRPCSYILRSSGPVVHTPVISSSYIYGSGPPRQEGGVELGLVEGEPMRLDIWSLPSHNILVSGETGSGKTFFSKLLIKRLLESGGLSITILDPLGDYANLVRALGGRVVRLEEGFVPDFLGIGWSDEERASNAELLISAISSPSPEESSAIRVAARKTASSSGSLEELMENLEAQGAARISRVLSRFLESRPTRLPGGDLVSYDLHALPQGDQTMALTYLALVLASRASSPGRKLVVVDEAWFLLSNVYSTRALASLSRHIRHSNGSLLTITQSVSDLLSSREAQAVARNSHIGLFFRQRLEGEVASFFGIDRGRLEILPSLQGGVRGRPSKALFLMDDYSMLLEVRASEEEISLLEGEQAERPQ